MRDTDNYLAHLRTKLTTSLRTHEAICKWTAFSHGDTRIYHPQVDIAVGPFATQPGTKHKEDYDAMVECNHGLLECWIKMFRENYRALTETETDVKPVTLLPRNHGDFKGKNSNNNARCFLAIELENKNSRKHLMGSIVNAGALGRIGVLVAWQDEALRAAIRMRRYFGYLKEAGKRTFNMTGVIVLTANQMEDSLG